LRANLFVISATCLHPNRPKKPVLKKKAPAPTKPTEKPTTPEGPKGDAQVTAGEAALEKLRARLSVVKPELLVNVRFNVRLASTAAVGLLDEIARAGLKERLGRLEAMGELDPDHAKSLADLARAAWYVRHRLDEAAALTGEARVSSAVVEGAAALRATMLRVLAFHFDEDPAVSAQLAYIRKGAGHHDLADDLTGLAALYKQHQGTLRGTPRYYQAQDAERAQKLADAILAELGQDKGSGVAAWADLQRRVALLLERAYDELASAARYLLRHDPSAEARFPKLHAVARARSNPTRTPKPGDPHDPGDPGA
jgi:hypothetical protein